MYFIKTALNIFILIHNTHVSVLVKFTVSMPLLFQYFNSQRDSLTEYQRRLLDMYLFECKITGSEVTNEKDLNLVQTQLRKEYDKQIEFL